MSRDMHPDNISAANEGIVTRVYFARLDYKNLPVYVSSVGFDLEFDWNGQGDVQTFVGVGGWGAMSEIEESGDLQSYAVDLELSGLDKDTLALAMGESYRGRECTIWRGFLDREHRLIAAPDIVFKGRMDTQPIDYGEGKITLTVHSVLQDWTRNRGRRYTNEDQQNQYPGDLGFEFVSQMVDKPLQWGQ